MNVMITALQATPRTAAETMVQSFADALCERPDESAAHRAARSREVVHSVLAFQPRDVLEIMLAGMAVTHAHLIQDSARDALLGQEDVLKARTKSTVVALDRGMIGFLRELRLAQTRPLEAAGAVDGGSEMPVAAVIAESKPSPVAVKPEIPRPSMDAWSPAAVPEPPVPLARSSAVSDSSVPLARPSVAAAPEPPVPLLAPSRSTETSVAAMLTVLTPPTTPHPERSTPARPPTPAASASQPIAFPAVAVAAMPRAAAAAG